MHKVCELRNRDSIRSGTSSLSDAGYNEISFVAAPLATFDAVEFSDDESHSPHIDSRSNHRNIIDGLCNQLMPESSLVIEDAPVVVCKDDTPVAEQFVISEFHSEEVNSDINLDNISQKESPGKRRRFTFLNSKFSPSKRKDRRPLFAFFGRNKLKSSSKVIGNDSIKTPTNESSKITSLNNDSIARNSTQECGFSGYSLTDHVDIDNHQQRGSSVKPNLYIQASIDSADSTTPEFESPPDDKVNNGDIPNNTCDLYKDRSFEDSGEGIKLHDCAITFNPFPLVGNLCDDTSSEIVQAHTNNINPHTLKGSKQKAYLKKLERLQVQTVGVVRPRSGNPLTVTSLSDYANLTCDHPSSASTKLRIKLPTEIVNQDASIKKAWSPDVCSEQCLFAHTKSALLYPDSSSVECPRRVLLSPGLVVCNATSPNLILEDQVDVTSKQSQPIMFNFSNVVKDTIVDNQKWVKFDSTDNFSKTVSDSNHHTTLIENNSSCVCKSDKDIKVEQDGDLLMVTVETKADFPTAKCLDLTSNHTFNHHNETSVF